MHPFGWTLKNRLWLSTIIFIGKADDGGFCHSRGVLLGLPTGCFSIGVSTLNNANAIASSRGIAEFYVRLYGGMMSVQKFAGTQLGDDLGMNGMTARLGGCAAWIQFAFRNTAEHVDQRSMR
jgi:hypothetical protein